MVDAFEGPKQLIDRAREHIECGLAIFEGYRFQQIFSPARRIDPETGETVHCVRMTGPALSSELSVAIKDAAGNLRASLDRAVYGAAVIIVGGEPKNTAFPIANDAAAVKKCLSSKKLCGNPPQLHPVLEGFRPHAGGNLALWQLDQLRNSDTSRFIVPAPFMVPGYRIWAAVRDGEVRVANVWDAENNVLEYMRMSPGTDIDVSHVGFSVDVAFAGIAALEGQPVFPALDAMAVEALRVVFGIEAECQRLGYNV